MVKKTIRVGLIAIVAVLLFALCAAAESTEEYATVVFNSNGGNGSMEPQVMEKDMETYLEPNSFTFTMEDGKPYRAAFCGWNTKADGSGTAYEDGQVVCLTEDLTLYAQWMATANNIDELEIAIANCPGDDISAAKELIVDGELSLDLKGKHLHLNGYSLAVNGKLTVFDSMTGGRIDGTNSSDMINVKKNAEMTIWDITIANMSVGYWSSAVRASGTVIMYSGTIKAGKCGVYVNGKDGRFTMEGGALEGNGGSSSNGISLASQCTVSIHGGSITGWGTGIYPDYDPGDKTEITGGTITQNKTGVDLEELRISGAPVISGNTGNDILVERTNLVLTGALSEGAAIGVKTQKDSYSFADNWGQYMGESSPTDCFICGNDGYSIEKAGNGLFIYQPSTAQSGTLADDLSWVLDENGTLTISGSGWMTRYGLSEQAPWGTGIRRVVIGEGVTSIGSRAFRNCGRLTEVVFPESSLESINDSAFEGCTGLTSINLPDSVYIIGSYAFENCRSLARITMPTSNLTIGRDAFLNCSSLVSFRFPDNATEIKEEVLKNCTSLQSVVIPDSIKYIQLDAFSGCSSLESITLPEGVEWLTIDFNFETNLMSDLVIGSGNDVYATVDGVLYTKDMTKLLLCPRGKTEVDIPEGVTEIDRKAFKECKRLTRVTLPESMSVIGGYAFYDCKSLENLVIPDGVTEIGTYLCYGCENLQSVTIPDSVTAIRDCAFSGCGSLTGALLPEALAEIGGDAFYECTGLTEVTIPEGVTEIGSRAFYHCVGLTNVTLPESLTRIDSEAFCECTGLTEIRIPDNTTVIGARAFCRCYGLTGFRFPDGTKGISSALAGCTGLKSVYIPESVTAIGSEAFDSCLGLTEITIPKNVTTIYYRAFNNCRNLRSISLPDGVTSVESSVFTNCPALVYTHVGTETAKALGKTGNAFRQPGDQWNLKCVVSTDGNVTGVEITSLDEGIVHFEIPEYVNRIGSGTFKNHISLKTVTIPDQVNFIGSDAFRNCTALMYISIPDSVTTIGTSAFNGCRKMESAKLPSHLTTIPEYAFYECSRLKTVNIPDSVTQIEGYAFSGCEELQAVTFPDGVTGIGFGAFLWCKKLTKVTIPASVTNLGGNAFNQCSALKNVYFAVQDTEQQMTFSYDTFSSSPVIYCYMNTAPDIQFRDGYNIVYLDDMEALHRKIMQSVNAGELSCVFLPAQLTTIEASAFAGLNCEVIIIPESCRTIGSEAFANCRNLLYVYVPETVSEIAGDAFSGCTGIVDRR